MSEAPDPTERMERSLSLLYVEHFATLQRSGSIASTTDGRSSGGQSDISAQTKTKSISMLQTMGLSIAAMTSSKLDPQQVALFKEQLHSAGIDTSKWGFNGAKSIEHLFWETHQQKGCIIMRWGPEGALKRVTRLVKIRLVAEIFGVDHFMYSRMQFMHDGQTVERKQVPLRKLVWQQSAEEFGATLQGDYNKLCEEKGDFIESWKEAWSTTLEERLGLTQSWQSQHLAEDPDAYRYTIEDDVKSDGYPGLNTLYCIHEVTLRVRDPEHPGVRLIGLPEGQEFATAEGDFNFNGQQDDRGLVIGSQLNIWTWMRVSQVTASVSLSRARSMSVVHSQAGHAAAAAAAASKLQEEQQKQKANAPASSSKDKDHQLIRRVPLAGTSAKTLAGMQVRLSKKSRRAPGGVLWAVMEGLQTDWTTVRRMAKDIGSKKYTLDKFNADLLSFPELNLYLLESKNSCGTNSCSSVSSGRTIGDEYQRTIGAFFAIYWLFRLDSDGRDGFSFGVDDQWRPFQVATSSDIRVTQTDKRLNFKNNAKWEFFQKLLINAGLLEERSTGHIFKSEKKLVVNEKRLVSLLALTAIHDVMKMTLILPECQPEHEPYHGYSGGDTIGDHDHALSYVMQHYPDIFPSFRDLDPDERRSVLFTQCNLCFNHGWFVQAEAPPGAIFTKFREALIRDHKSQIGQRDVALYFVHWLTDLAGAEPSPLAGCEKFVTKFPLPVLNSFLRSFEFVEQIATRTETEVMEEYLKMRWTENDLDLGPLPTGSAAIAKMRLLCMAQGNASVILHDWDKLTDEDRETLAVEMSRTGCVGQTFSQDLCPRDTWERLEGPAFLVYYGPAFLQQMGTDLPVERLSVLAEIYRGARELWPTSISKVASNVTVRIDIIKALSIEEMYEAILRGDTWLLVKHNESEAFVERSSHRKLNKLIATSSSFQVLDLSCLKPYAMYR